MTEIQFYNASSLALLFHDMPRIQGDGSSAPTDFDPDSREYLEGIVFVALPFVAIGFFSIAFFVHLACLRFCKRGKEEDEEEDECDSLSARVTRSFFLSLAVTFFGAGFCIFASSWVSGRVDGIDSGLKAIDSEVDSSLESSRIISNSLEQMTSQVSGFESLVLELSASNHLESVPVVVSSVLANISSVLEQAEGNFNLVNTSIEIAEASSSRTKDLDSDRQTAQLAALLLLALPMILVVLGVIFRSNRILWASLCVGVLSGGLGWALGGIELSATVALADFCIDPNRFVLEQVSDETIVDYAKYYIVCHNQLHPLTDDVSRTTAAITTTEEGAPTISLFAATINHTSFAILEIANARALEYSQAHGGVSVNVTDFFDNVTVSDILAVIDLDSVDVDFVGFVKDPVDSGAVGELINFAETLETVTETARQEVSQVAETTAPGFCAEVHNSYVKSVDGMCSNVLDLLLSLAIAQCVLAVAVSVSVVSTCFIYEHLRYLQERDQQATLKQILTPMPRQRRNNNNNNNNNNSSSKNLNKHINNRPVQKHSRRDTKRGSFALAHFVGTNDSYDDSSLAEPRRALSRDPSRVEPGI